MVSCRDNTRLFSGRDICVFPLICRKRWCAADTSSTLVYRGGRALELPYELDFDLGMTEPANIFEFPVTLEDEQLPPLLDRVPALLDTIEANAENGAPSVLLIHSNNAQEKLQAERALLSRLPQDILVENMTAYAHFWKARDQLRWFAKTVEAGEQIEINVELPISGLTLVSLRRIRNASGLVGIRWTDHEVVLPNIEAKSRVQVQLEYF